MIRKKLTRRRAAILCAGIIIAALCLYLSSVFSYSEEKPLYATAVAAAQRMQECMDAVKDEKLSRGISISAEDRFETGLIGESFNFITTTRGDIEAKRTTCDPNMAGLMVFMLDEAGVKSGDTVGCCFSGSFPALNIAVLCACDAIGATPVYICSCGASTWGANNPEFSFPEMAVMLYNQSLISALPALITPGGSSDTGKGLDSEDFSPVWERAQALGCETLYNTDFAENVAYKKALLDENNISCFVAVGGGISAMGQNMVVDMLGQGIITEEITRVNSGSGLIERYLYEKLPTILLLNIKQLAADYGFAFDPSTRCEIGQAPYYFETLFPLYIPVLGIFAEAVLLIIYRRDERNGKE